MNNVIKEKKITVDDKNNKVKIKISLWPRKLNERYHLYSRKNIETILENEGVKFGKCIVDPGSLNNILGEKNTMEKEWVFSIREEIKPKKSDKNNKPFVQTIPSIEVEPPDSSVDKQIIELFENLDNTSEPKPTAKKTKKSTRKKKNLNKEV